MKNTNKPGLPAGIIKTTIQILGSLHEAMIKIQMLRRPREGSDVRLCRIYREAVETYLSAIDWETGYLKPPQRTPFGRPPVTGMLPLFHHYVDCDQFGDDSALFRLMDESWMMLWASGPNIDSQHVNPRMVEYTGRPATEFLGGGWANLLHPDDREGTVQTCVEGFATQKDFRLVYRLRRRDGLYAWVADNAHPRFRDDKFAGYIGTAYQVAEPGDNVQILAYERGRLSIIFPKAGEQPPSATVWQSAHVC